LNIASLRLHLVLVFLTLAAAFVGCGDSNESTQTPPAPPVAPVEIIAPSLSLVAATGTTTAYLDWGTAQVGVTYEIHAAEADAFVPSSSTLLRSVVGVSSASVTGLRVATSYTFKLIAHQSRNSPKESTNSLRLQMLERDLAFRSDLVLTSQSALGITSATRSGNSLQLLLGTGGASPTTGSYLAGQLVDGTDYFVKINSIRSVDGIATAETEPASIVDVLQSGSIRYVMSFDEESRANRLIADDKKKPLAISSGIVWNCDAGLIPGGLIVPRHTFVMPSLVTTFGRDALGKSFVDTSLIGPLDVTAGFDISMFLATIGAECKSDVYPFPGPVRSVTLRIGFIPVTVGARLSLRVKAKLLAAGSGTIEVRPAGLTGNVDVGVTVHASDGLNRRSGINSLSVIAPDVRMSNAPVSPGFPVGPISLSGDLSINLGADAFLEGFHVATVGFRVGPKLEIETLRNGDQVQIPTWTGSPQTHALHKFDLGLRQAFFAELVLHDYLRRFIPVGIGSLGIEVPLGEDALFFSLPELNSRVFNQEGKRFAEALFGGGTGFSVDPNSLQWHSNSTSDPSSLIATSDPAKIEVPLTHPDGRCLQLTYSANVIPFGEYGKRFKSPAIRPLATHYTAIPGPVAFASARELQIGEFRVRGLGATDMSRSARIFASDLRILDFNEGDAFEIFSAARCNFDVISLGFAFRPPRIPLQPPAGSCIPWPLCEVTAAQITFTGLRGNPDGTLVEVATVTCDFGVLGVGCPLPLTEQFKDISTLRILTNFAGPRFALDNLFFGALPYYALGDLVLK
jgi:hypothetical protein